MIDAAGWLAAGQFYLAMLLLAWATLPLTAYLTPGRIGAGWALARCAAMPLVTYIAWTLAAFGAPWGGTALVIGIVLVAALSALTLWRSPRTRRAISRSGKLWRAEALYVALFVIVLTIRAWDADLFGLEKFMNIAFVNSVYHAASLPAADPWLAGETINYYYFGHATVALASLMTGQPTDMGTNLMFGHVFAATGLACAMAIAAIARRAGASQRLTRVMACLGTATLILGGNYHSVVYGIVRPLLASWGLAEPYEYFFAHSSRFIGHRPETADKTITEFPGYSIAVGDLHAHVMNLPIAAALLVLILGVALGRRAGWAALTSGGARRTQALASGTAMILLLAMSAMANSWDVPVYLALLGLALIAVSRARGIAFVPATLEAGTICVMLLLAALAASVSFWQHFVPFSQGLRWTIYGSTGWQLALLYGNYFLAGIIVLVATDGMTGLGLARARLSVAVLLIAAAIILSVPEFIYVKDLYGDDNARANTMFKLSYQTYLMLPVAAFAGAAAAMARMPYFLARTGMIAVVTLFCASPLVFAVLTHGQNIFIKLSEPTHVDGLRFLKNGDHEAELWLDAHRPPPGEAMLEASGDSFTYAGRLAASTGIPTVLGWHAHEWLWRNSAEIWQPRADAIRDFYQTMDDERRQGFIKAWRIRYVVIGDFERERYAALNAGAIEALGKMVFESGGTRIIEIAR
jgi:uncharacterized membrane protein